MTRPRLLDLFCGAGGAAMGYHRAGFDVYGVDCNPQPHYPFAFHLGDAMRFPLDGFDAIHASPPCQAYTTMANRFRGQGGPTDDHPDLIAATRTRLAATGVPYVIENVPGARSQLHNPITLNGGMFGLGVNRPRLFASNVLILVSDRVKVTDPLGVYGKADGRRLWTRADGSEQRNARTLDEARQAMGMDWGDWHGVKEAIPPAYTQFIGEQLLAHWQGRRVTDVWRAVMVACAGLFFGAAAVTWWQRSSAGMWHELDRRERERERV